MNRTLVIVGHPNPDSYGAALAGRYVQSARDQGAQVEVLDLSALSFDPAMRHGYRAGPPLEPDLVRAQALLKWCDHLCVVTPVWWSGLPAPLKGFFDRVLLPGFAFRYTSAGLLEPLLAGRSARLIQTADAPPVFLRYLMGDPVTRSLGRNTLAACGFKKLRVTRLGPVRKSSPQQRERWLAQIAALAVHDHPRARQTALA